MILCDINNHGCLCYYLVYSTHSECHRVDYISLIRWLTYSTVITPGWVPSITLFRWDTIRPWTLWSDIYTRHSAQRLWHDQQTFNSQYAYIFVSHFESWLSGRLQCISTGDIKNNAWVTVNKDFFGHEWGNLPIVFRSFVTSENHWQIASRVTQKSLFTATNVLLYFLHAISCPNTQFCQNNYRSLISPLSLR